MTATKKIRRFIPVESPEMTQLERALLCAGCEILDEDGVASEKKAKLDARMAKVRNAALDEVRRRAADACLLWVASGVAIYSVAIVAFAILRATVLRGTAPLPWAWIIGGFLAYLFFACAVVGFRMDRAANEAAPRVRLPNPPPQWNTLGPYTIALLETGPLWILGGLVSVPPPLLQQARLIERYCPEARFEVETFYEDPFIAVCLGRERFYFGKWDEPEKRWRVGI